MRAWSYSACVREHSITQYRSLVYVITTILYRTNNTTNNRANYVYNNNNIIVLFRYLITWAARQVLYVQHVTTYPSVCPTPS